jgi:hypothetical protein
MKTSAFFCRLFAILKVAALVTLFGPGVSITKK